MVDGTMGLCTSFEEKNNLLLLTFTKGSYLGGVDESLKSIFHLVGLE
jgi:hypothetical protein